MTTFALIHGSWGSGWHWASVPARLRELGHEAVAPDLPCEDPAATFDDYAQVVLDALRDTPGGDVVVVGFSLGGLAAALVAARRPVRELVYLAAVVPEPGMSLHDQIRRGDRMFLPKYLEGITRPDANGISRWVDFGVYHDIACHDCDEPVARERFDRSRGQATGAYVHPCSLDAQPDVPTRYALCAEDRLMDNGFWEPLVRRQVDPEPAVLPGSHSPMASRPEELVRLLTATS